MGAIGVLLRQIVGEKPWFRSMTVLGVVLFVAAQGVAEALVSLDMLSPVVGLQIQEYGTKASAVLVALGFRKLGERLVKP